MDMDSAAVFLAGSILYGLGFLFILIAVIVANNIIHKYWKSFGWTFMPGWVHEHNSRFLTPEEAAKIAPHLDDDHGKEKSKTI